MKFVGRIRHNTYFGWIWTWPASSCENHYEVLHGFLARMSGCWCKDIPNQDVTKYLYQYAITFSIFFVVLILWKDVPYSTFGPCTFAKLTHLIPSVIWVLAEELCKGHINRLKIMKGHFPVESLHLYSIMCTCSPQHGGELVPRKDD